MATIRTASTEDAGAIAQLITRLNEAVDPEGGVSASPDNVLVTQEQARARIAAMAGTEQVLLAEANGEAVGLLSLRILPYLAEDVPLAEVAELYVEPPHRRGRIGMLLIAEAEHIARQRGCRVMHVRAWHKNEQAHAFYRAVGYESAEFCFERVLPRKSSAQSRRAEG